MQDMVAPMMQKVRSIQHLRKVQMVEKRGDSRHCH